MRGGWGGGRGGTGHFRPQPSRPAVKDEDGNVIPQPPPGPPPLFPEMELPELPEQNNRTKMLITKRQELSRHCKSSPFYIETKPSTTGKDGPDSEVETFAERARKRPRTSNRPPLSSVMRLDPQYFPEELYSNQDKRASKASQSRPQQELYWQMQGSRGEDAEGLQLRLDRLAELESKAGEPGGMGAGDGTGARRDVDQEPQDEVIVDEDEEEEDDYYVGDQFDDDDDGDDGDDYGGDAIY